MKKVKFSGKLNLNKETVAKLNEEQMKGIVGGGPNTARSYCECVPPPRTKSPI